MKFTSFFSVTAVTLFSLVLLDAQKATGKLSTNKAHYDLVIYKGENTKGPVLSQVTLNCHPPGGTHPQADVACSVLDKTIGVFEDLKDNGTICNFIYDPVTATAKGNGYGKDVNFMKTYSNRCVLNGSTSRVFEF